MRFAAGSLERTKCLCSQRKTDSDSEYDALYRDELTHSDDFVCKQIRQGLNAQIQAARSEPQRSC